MARVIPLSFIIEESELIPIWAVDKSDNLNHNPRMTCGNMSGGIAPQAMVDQRPKFENSVRKRKKRRTTHPTQVISQAGVIRPDKRIKAKYL